MSSQPDIIFTLSSTDPETGEPSDVHGIHCSFEGSHLVDVPPMQGDRIVLSFPMLLGKDAPPGQVTISIEPLDLLRMLNSYLVLFEARLAWKSISRTRGLHEVLRDLVDELGPMLDRCSIRDEMIAIVESRLDALPELLAKAVQRGEVPLSPTFARSDTGQVRALNPLRSEVMDVSPDTDPEAHLHAVHARMEGPCTERQVFALAVGAGQVQAHIAHMMGGTAES